MVYVLKNTKKKTHKEKKKTKTDKNNTAAKLRKFSRIRKLLARQVFLKHIPKCTSHTSKTIYILFGSSSSFEIGSHLPGIFRTGFRVHSCGIKVLKCKFFTRINIRACLITTILYRCLLVSKSICNASFLSQLSWKDIIHVVVTL